jgi:hypothetical protein
MGFSEKFFRASDSVTQPVYFGPEETVGTQRYKRLAGDGTRCVYAVENCLTGKYVGLFEKTSSGYVRCKPELLVELLRNDIYQKPIAANASKEAKAKK